MSRQPIKHPQVGETLPTMNFVLTLSRYITLIQSLVVNKKALTKLLNYDKLVSEYIGIVVYFDGKKNSIKTFIESRQNKKQNEQLPLTAEGDPFGCRAVSKRRAGPASTASTQGGQFIKKVFDTFCFLAERFLFKRSDKNKNINQYLYDRGALSAPRHPARDRSKQNDRDPLGGRGINPESNARQPRLALLYQTSSGRNNPLGSGNQLLPESRLVKSTRNEHRGRADARYHAINSLGVLLFHTAQYVVDHTIHYFFQPAYTALKNYY